MSTAVARQTMRAAVARNSRPTKPTGINNVTPRNKLHYYSSYVIVKFFHQLNHFVSDSETNDSVKSVLCVSKGLSPVGRQQDNFIPWYNLSSSKAHIPSSRHSLILLSLLLVSSVPVT